ncbi:MAG: PIN domain-containing protein [Blastocatellia bacterium]
MAEHLLDTNVLSKIFYGDAKVKEFVDGIDAGIETVVYIELIQGSISKKDKDRIRKSLAQVKYYSLTSDIAIQAIELIDKYSSTNGLFLADALIASTALTYDLMLVTYNRKDFKFITGLTVIEPKI